MIIRPIVFGLLFSTAIASAQTEPSTAPSTRPAATAEEQKVSRTHHEITVDGKRLAYQATAGEMAMKDESGKAKANMFFVAYDLDQSGEPSARPVTFLFNGGPGAAAVWLHLGAAGPKTIEMGDGDLPVGPPFNLIDNTATWLPATDMVF